MLGVVGLLLLGACCTSQPIKRVSAPRTRLEPGEFAYDSFAALGYEAVRLLRKEPYSGSPGSLELKLKPGGEYEISFRGANGWGSFGERGVWRQEGDKLILQRYRGRRRGSVSEWGSSEWGRDPKNYVPEPAKPPPLFRVARVFSPDAILLPWWGGWPWEFLLRRRGA